jgi:hypothetical protein
LRFVVGPPPKPAGETEELDGWIKLRELTPDPAVAVSTVASLALFSAPALFVFRVLSFDLQQFLHVGFLAVAFTAYVAHELTHAFLLPKAGFSDETFLGLWPGKFMLYCTHTGIMSRERFLISALGPFVVLGLLPLAAVLFYPARVLVLVSLMNFLLAGLDLMIAVLVLHQVPAGARFRIVGWDAYWQPTA